MSEYQYVAFRAIDAPVSEQNLEFMRQQSSRAEITPWSFVNEYHFGDFRGDEVKMLRRGYDFHFHYANFGVRKLMIRLPNGLPDAKAVQPYLEEDGLTFLKDKPGQGGILCFDPFFEPDGFFFHENLNELLDRLIPLRAEILDGDLHPLYLAQLGVLFDNNHDPEEAREGPVPAGLEKPTDAQRALAGLYKLGEAMIAAAARNGPRHPKKEDSQNPYEAWLQRQPDATKTAWLAQLLADPDAKVRKDILAEFRKSQGASTWPTVRLNRLVTELRSVAKAIEQEKNRKEAEAAAQRRAKKLADMATDPASIVRETEDLVKKRTTKAYHQIALLLADLREALAGSEQSDLPRKQAQKLKKDYPKLNMLVSELRKQGFLKKEGS